ncbi:hypothetical protein ACN47E_001951 [Coniothyrium glycines]
MTPNLLVATQKAFSPHKWFKSNKTARPTREIEERDSPVPGRYERIPGRGLYLIARLQDSATTANASQTGGGPVLSASSSPRQEYVKLDRPIPVTYSKYLKRYLLDDEFRSRKKRGTIKNDRGKQVEVGFFQLDDGITWVQCYDEEDTFLPADSTGYKRWCIDAQTNQFRHMRKGDDPNYIRSRRNSSERGVDRHSQDSRSTLFRSGPGSTRDGPSMPSSRPASIRYPTSTTTSTLASQRPSRQNSPQRNNSVALEEAKAALRRMALEQQEAATVLAATRSRTHPKARTDHIERGRSTVRVGN